MVKNRPKIRHHLNELILSKLSENNANGTKFIRTIYTTLKGRVC